MDDVLGVRGGKRGGDLLRDVHRGLDGQATRLLDPVLEILALEILHHEIRLARLGQAEVDDVDQVRMTELRGDLGLAVKARERFRVGGQLAGHELDGDAFVEAQLNRLIDRTHPALALEAYQAVGPFQDGSC